MNDITIVYYTANTEDETFSQRLRDEIVKNSGGLPIISVSRKPIDFGTNICVGEVPICDSSALRQLLTGLKEVKTKFAIAAEADVLYPPEYFTFTPPVENEVYRYLDVYLLWTRHNHFFRKRFSEGAQMCGVKHWIEKLEEALLGAYEWNETKVPSVFNTNDTFVWTSPNPVVSFKTGNGLRMKAGGIVRSERPKSSLPFWGSVEEVKKKYL